jgi:hydroxymethylglutaryl-CoA reductase
MITENLRRLNASGGSKKLIAEQQAKLSKMQETLKRQQQAGAEIARAKKNVKSTQTQINDLTT